MIRIAKPRTARSKRVLQKREPKEFESCKKAIFVRGSHTSEKVSIALRELSLLKKPYSIPFNKKNEMTPFEDASSLEFWGKKNDASLFVLANHQKKRPHNLTFARLFDGSLLDMYEMGIESIRGHDDFKSKHPPTVGARPMFHFSGTHFGIDDETSQALAMCTPGVSQSMQHIKSLFLDFFRGEEIVPGSGPGSVPGQAGLQVALKAGLQHIISISEAPSEMEVKDKSNGINTTADDLQQLYKAGALQTNQSSSASMIDTSASGCVIHFRVYAIVPASNGNAPSTSNLTLEEIGPSIDLTLRRRHMADIGRFNASLKRPKTQAEKNRQGKGVKKNIETDEMGDMVGRVHLGRQDLGKLQTRKMKGLKRGRQANGQEGEDSGDDGSQNESAVGADSMGDMDDMEAKRPRN